MDLGHTMTMCANMATENTQNSGKYPTIYSAHYLGYFWKSHNHVRGVINGKAGKTAALPKHSDKGP